jgi:glutamine amidotransferase
MNKKVAIIDYKLGNLFSVKHACDYIGLDSSVTSDASVVAEADAIILPGVGAFREGMNNLDDLKLSDVIKMRVNAGTPLFGICLGLQMLFTESEEFGSTKGLDIIKGKIIKFPEVYNSTRLKIPQIGWNRVIQQSESKWNESSLTELNDGTYMYFVHSYYAKPENSKDILTMTNYGGFEYCSSVFNDQNVFATQFHPEKSGQSGITIYKQWALKHKLFNNS